MESNSFDTVKIQFEKFLSLIRNVLTYENEVITIQNKLRRHFNTATSDYLCSNDFVSLLNYVQDMFVENNKSTKYFTLLASFDEQLKKHSIKLPRSNLPSTQVAHCSTSMILNKETISINENTTETHPLETLKSTIEYEVSIIAVQETIEYLLDQCCNIISEFNVQKTPCTNETLSIPSESNCERKRQRKIMKLERRLSRLSRIIRELEKKDMSLDEMAHCDLYVVESNLKKQACEVYFKLTKLKSQSSSIERIIHQPIVLNEFETGHSLINKDLQDMVNQSKHFPSFSDVLSTVNNANDKYQFNISDDDRKVIAEKSFKMIGREIKKRRMADFHDIMHSRLPKDFNIDETDPALNNAEIEKVLIENNREAVIKTEQIFEEYSRIEPDSHTETNFESDEEEPTIEEKEKEQSPVTLETNEIHYDIADITALSSPELIMPESNSIGINSEISLRDRQLTILSTASLPIGRTTYHRQVEINNKTRSSSTISKDDKVDALIPQCKQNCINNEIIYKLYQQRLTNNLLPGSNSIVTNKRQLTTNNDYSNGQKSKQQKQQPEQQQSEIIVLD